VTTLHGSDPLNIKPLSRIEVILLAVDDCAIMVNGSPVALKSGERRFVHGRQTVNVSSSDKRPALLVVVNVRTARQAQAFDRIELLPGKVTEDASARNETLLVALVPLRLRDIIDNSGEGEPTKLRPTAVYRAACRQNSLVVAGDAPDHQRWRIIG
jgi:hypothetical protein